MSACELLGDSWRIRFSYYSISQKSIVMKEKMAPLDEKEVLERCG